MLITGIGHLSIRNLVLEILSEWGLPSVPRMEEAVAPNSIEIQKGVITITKEDLNHWMAENSGQLMDILSEEEILNQFSISKDEFFLEGSL